ncbi:MAG: response regulator transcription factor [Elusimicrobia bacterium]|nr:response regulator transcription factor [Elusimicrobiota bacterium]
MSAEPPRIVVIEDDPDVYELLDTILQQKQYNVKLARNGLDGLRLVKDFKPHLVVLDLMIPRMDGFKVLESIRSMDAEPKVKVLVLTALGQVAYVDKALALGADAYVTKPFEMHRFLGKVQALLANGQA